VFNLGFMLTVMHYHQLNPTAECVAQSTLISKKND